MKQAAITGHCSNGVATGSVHLMVFSNPDPDRELAAPISPAPEHEVTSSCSALPPSHHIRAQVPLRTAAGVIRPLELLSLGSEMRVYALCPMGLSSFPRKNKKKTFATSKGRTYRLILTRSTKDFLDHSRDVVRISSRLTRGPGCAHPNGPGRIPLPCLYFPIHPTTTTTIPQYPDPAGTGDEDRGKRRRG